MSEPSPSPRTAPDAPTVLIVDDHDLVGTSLAVALTAEGLRAQRPRRGPRRVLAEAAALPPGLALLDLDLGPRPAGAAARRRRARRAADRRGWCCMVLSAADRSRVGAALAAGAIAAVPKRAPWPVLLANVRAALHGRSVMSPQTRQELIDSFRARTRSAARSRRSSTG